MLVSCSTCWSAAPRVGQLHMLVSSTCWSAPRVGQLHMLVSSTCWSAPHVGLLLHMLVSSTCWSSTKKASSSSSHQNVTCSYHNKAEKSLTYSIRWKCHLVQSVLYDYLYRSPSPASNELQSLSFCV